jgi:hypothetical protein
MHTHNLLCRLLLASFVWLFATPSWAQDDGVYWFNNYSDALQEAKRTGKPIFLEYRCEP